MKCALCEKNEALVHVTEVAGSFTRKVDLCTECAAAHNINGPFDPTGASLLKVFQLIAAKRRNRKPQ